MAIKQLLLLLSVGALLFCGCGSDSYVYPSVQLEFIVLHADEAGETYLIETDKGALLTIRDNLAGYTLPLPYASERVVAYYEVVEEPQGNSTGTADLWSVSSIVCHEPGTLESFGLEALKTDPVSIQSVWLSGSYINLTLGVLAQNGGHSFYFIQGDSYLKEDTVVSHVILYHDKNNDVEAYTQKLYASLPVDLSDALQVSTKEIHLHINTYKEGTVTYTFTYPE